MLINTLEELDLTKTEARIYLAVLELGSCLAGEITKKTGIHRRSVYDSVERLIQKGLLSYIKTNNRKHFEAINPEILLSQIKEKQNSIKAILPELSLKFNMARKKQDTTFYKGQAGLKSVFNDQIQEKKEILVFGASTDINNVLKFYLPHYENARKKYRIPVKIIYDQSAKKDTLLHQRPYLKVKYLPKQYRSPSSTNIYGNKVAILLWEDE
ncbi:MAG: helix-turn-helix domain-containing protein, partial [Candidatus Woesearchaeota archaeon]|nr:helix-turn-helix domain-containing protein [Candidatus Woesearchaeota archaeon]